jgi:hypothetical protein
LPTGIPISDGNPNLLEIFVTRPIRGEAQLGRGVGTRWHRCHCGGEELM